MFSLMFCVCIALGSTWSGAQTLPDAVRRHGMVEGRVIIEYSPVTLREIASGSDVIARVLILKHRSRLTRNEQSIETSYSVQVLQLVHATGVDVREGSVILITKPGGELVIDGKSIPCIESDFPPLDDGAEYIALLKHRARHNDFEFYYGGQGAFGIANGLVRQLSTKFGTWNETHPATTVSALLAELSHESGERQP